MKSKSDYDKKAYVKWKNEFMMNIDNYSAEYYLRAQFATQGRSDDFLRVQVVTSISMDDISKTNLDKLQAAGNDLYDKEKESIIKMVEAIVDEKFGPKATPDSK